MILNEIIVSNSALILIKANTIVVSDSLKTVSNTGYTLAIVMLLVSVLLFFLFKIPETYGDITGKAAKKAIEKIKLQNEAAVATGAKAFSPNTVNLKKGRTSGKIQNSRQLITPPLPVPAVQIAQPVQASSETAFLGVPAQQQAYSGRFNIERDITYINTNEIIQ